MPNRLAGEISPYLLQHAENPVDWCPWNEEALQAARDSQRPIFLSIGYSACHWCHVMERESFENPAIAAYLNEHFVSIKVDREERPDLDQIYMTAVQLMTGRGGWPLSMFLTPDLQPFYGGTYWPPESRHGMPGFDRVLRAVIDAWTNRREQAIEQAAALTRDVRRIGGEPAMELNEPIAEQTNGPPSLFANPPRVQELAELAVTRLVQSADLVHGGFGAAPKFPHPMDIQLLLRHAELEGRSDCLDIAQLTLDKMAAGGIYDHLGGGFARYSVDDRWLVPHFEKMLYDNALLARTYLRAWQVTGHDRYRWVAQKTLDWAMSEMLDASGGFYASLDADSEGVEGLFYTWTPAEIGEALGGRAPAVIEAFGVTEEGHLDGRSVLHLPAGVPPDEIEPGFEELSDELLAARTKRVRPALDDKVISSWNSLMVSALAEAGAVLERPDYLEAAHRTADFIWNGMRGTQGNLLRTWRHGEARLNAYLEDHAFLLEALLDLYQADFNPAVFDRARAVAETMIDRFADPARGGFFTTSHDHEELIARRKDVGDHPIPSGSSSAALGLLKLSALTGEATYRRKAEEVLKLLAPAIARQPSAFGHLLQALALYGSSSPELAITWTADSGMGDAAPLVREARRRFRPNLVMAAGPEGTDTPPLLRERIAVKGAPAAYVCENFTCKAPVTEPADLGKELDALDQ
ncbi:MAG: thioredoxin domain-containing protein [Solirubrobacterales bacterium]|nr:thioredoxin domain-containing protein [Solirubrobacterales bacterium]